MPLCRNRRVQAQRLAGSFGWASKREPLFTLSMRHPGGVVNCRAWATAGGSTPYPLQAAGGSNAAHNNKARFNQMMSTMIKQTILAGALAVSASASAVHAGEAEFLRSLDGKWAGDGSVKVRTNSSPVKVSCNFNSDTTDTSLSLAGKCRGLVVFSKAIRADLKSNGAKYAGSYVGAGTGTAG